MFGSGGNINDASNSNDASSPGSPPDSKEGGESSVGSPSSSSSHRRSEKDKKEEKPSHHKKKTSKARDLITSAKNSIGGAINSIAAEDKKKSFRVLPSTDQDVQLVSPGYLNNAAGDSRPGPRTTFRVGVTEDKNKKCRRTMEDTHSFLYNFLASSPDGDSPAEEDSDNGYFAIFDGHAGTYAAEWCGRRLHHVLEEMIRKHPNTPIPELLDMTFTNCDGQLEKLPVKNSGCTAVCAVLRWEDRAAPGLHLPTAAVEPREKNSTTAAVSDENAKPNSSPTPPATRTERQRVLYTANVGDARIVLCRGGKALRLSYDHKGSDENEGKRVANAGGLILNNRVNGVLAVTRALGDSYMKELVTGHPYTTESVVQHDLDEFIILACDGLWDVCTDQEAVDLVRYVKDPQEASKILVNHALSRMSSDNLSCMIVRLDPSGKFEGVDSSPIGSPEPKADAGEDWREGR
ncbi:phosphatase 2C-like domain-containing protein [Tricharina praecox]|uniref:phosphatase 2C-like domain-containing protein n=1 Tax=Tricharina praecox TaxID=43433 RepID=UPI00221E484C|nr:phosphatase 2C-like domain-containing protein [Tricharina praecox]KAI5845562.1 phosphatase 2C-like domain-containing protein [Tricharina praecox]